MGGACVHGRFIRRGVTMAKHWGVLSQDGR